MHFIILQRVVCAGLLGLLSVLPSQATSLYLTRADKTEIEIRLKAQSATPSTDLFVILQGSDCNSVAHNTRINEQFSQVMPDADVLTIEKYGITPALPWSLADQRTDCPETYMLNDTPEQRVVDATQVLNQLVENGTYKRVVLMGGSEGALIANMLTARLDYISATISLNGGGERFQDTVLHNIAMSIEDDAAREESLAGFRGMIDKILNEPRFEVVMSEHGYDWWKSMFLINQFEELMQTQSPVLLVQGMADVNTSPDEARTMWAKLEAAGKHNITVKAYEDMDHFFKGADGLDQSQKVIADIQQWLAAL